MARWIIRSVGGNEVLRVRDFEQFTFADVTYPAGFFAGVEDEAIVALGFGVEHLAEELPEQPIIVSRLQFFRGLWKRELISQQEAVAAVKGAIPHQLQEIIDQLPEDARGDAEIVVAGASEFDSSHPLNTLIGSHLMSPAEIRGFYLFAKSL